MSPLSRLARCVGLSLALASLPGTGCNYSPPGQPALVLPLLPNQISDPTVGIEPLVLGWTDVAAGVADSQGGKTSGWSYQYGMNVQTGKTELENILDQNGDGSLVQRWEYEYSDTGQFQLIAHDATGNGYIDETWSYGFNSAGQISSIEWDNNSESRLWFYAYLSDGSLARISYGSDLWEYSYAADGTLTSYQHGSQIYRYSYLADGHLDRIVEGGDTWQYSWTSDGNIDHVTHGGESWDFSYDAKERTTAMIHRSGGSSETWTYSY